MVNSLIHNFLGCTEALLEFGIINRSKFVELNKGIIQGDTDTFMEISELLQQFAVRVKERKNA